MADFEQIGRSLLDNGYLIVPIRTGGKNPSIPRWQSARLTVNDLAQYDGAGVGILTGQGDYPVCALDIDTLHPELAEEFSEWCRTHLGAAPERIGQAPKTLFVYRAAEPDWRKITGGWWQGKDKSRHRVEVLGRGQQFVAYHIHPDTRKPYEWIDLLGGLEAVSAQDLPVVTQDQLRRALTQFDALAIHHGLLPVKGQMTVNQAADIIDSGDLLMAFEPTVGLPLNEAMKLLSALGAQDYDTWLRAGMALHHEYEASDAALDAWDAWSQTAPNYAGRQDLELRWASFGQTKGTQPTTIRWLMKYGRQEEHSKLRQGQRTALDDAKQTISSCTDSIRLLSDVAPKMGQIAGDNQAMRAELVAAIRSQFKALTNTNISVMEARKSLDAPLKKKPVALVRQLTEFGNSERMMDRYAKNLMYVPELAGWFHWTDVYWQRADAVEIEHLAKETIKAMPQELEQMDSDAQREALLKWCALSQRDYVVKAMVSLGRSDPRVMVPVNELDKQLHLLGVANGAVDLRTGQLLKSDPEHYITLNCGVEYDPDAKAPLWEQTVADAFYDNTDEIAFFQRFIGYCLLGKPDEDILAIPYGTGSNGKSTILGAIRDVLGDYARTARSETFLTAGGAQNNAGAPREDILRLRGARFVYITEPEEGSELREGFIKSMTGGEAMAARGLYARSTVEIVPTWVGVMPTNHKPIVKGDDHGIWRRLLLIPFTRNFDNDPAVIKDVLREQRLRHEAPGILRWCVEGALQYLDQGLKAPQPVQAARERYRGEMDLLGDWLDTCCELSPDAEESNAHLWASWEAYARTHGELRLIPNSRALGRRLASRFEAIRTHKGRGFKGVRITTIGDFADDGSLV